MSYATSKIDELRDKELALSVSLYIENPKMKKRYINKFLNYCRTGTENESKRVARGKPIEYDYIKELGEFSRKYNSLLSEIDLRKQLDEIHKNLDL
jgi:hypothetical protein